MYKSFRFWVVSGILLLLLAIVVSRLGNPKKQLLLHQDQSRLSNEQIFKEDPLLRQGSYSGATDPSFEMRENVDFLLTPAILVQECISDGVILIYPEE
jgi:hypothetical protein